MYISTGRLSVAAASFYLYGPDSGWGCSRLAALAIGQSTGLFASCPSRCNSISAAERLAPVRVFGEIESSRSKSTSTARDTIRESRWRLPKPTRTMITRSLFSRSRQAQEESENE